MTDFAFFIPRWHPTRLNVLLNSNRWERSRMKRADASIIAAYAREARIPPAEGPRRLQILIVLRPGQRGADVDAYQKVTCDSCKRAGLIIDDNRQHLELPPVQYSRGAKDRWGTSLILTDL